MYARRVRLDQPSLVKAERHRTYDLSIELANLEVLLVGAPKVGEVAHCGVLTQWKAALGVSVGVTVASFKRNKQWTRLGSA